MSNTVIDGESLSLSQLKNLLKGERGIQGWDGHSPIHVQESKPTGLDVLQGDLWYQPSTKKLRLFDGTWEEVAKRGIQGLEGEKGEPGEDSTVPGPKGDKGKDADMSEVRTIAEVKSKIQVKEHEQKFDHTLIDPFLVGTKKVSEAGMEDGMVLTFDAKSNKLIYTTIKQVASQVNRLAGRGLSLPSQSGNSGKVLTTDGNRASWGTASSGGVTRSINSIAINTTAGSASATEYIYFVSGTTTLTMPTAVGNTNLYTIKNVGVGTVTVDTTAAQTIDGGLTASLPVQYTAIELLSDGSNWNVI